MTHKQAKDYDSLHRGVHFLKFIYLFMFAEIVEEAQQHLKHHFSLPFFLYVVFAWARRNKLAAVNRNKHTAHSNLVFSCFALGLFDPQANHKQHTISS